MNTEHSLPFEVIDIPGGRVYRLPVREIGAARFLALIPLGLVVVGTHFGYDLARSAIALPQFAGGVWLWLSLAVALLVWAWGCYYFLSAAAALWCGRTEIEVRDDGSLRSCDRVGWFRYHWAKLPPQTVQKLIVRDSSQVPNTEGRLPLKRGTFWQLAAQNSRGKLQAIAHYHKREVLEPLAPVLSQQLSLAATNADIATPATNAITVQVVEPPSRDVSEQPATSQVVCEQHANGVTLTVPPVGVLVPHGGMFIVGCVFETLGWVVLGIIVVSQFQGNPKPLALIGLAIVAIAAGTAMMLMALQAGLKRFIFAVVGDQLLLLEAGLLRSKRHEWTRDAIADIVCDTNHFSQTSRGKPFLGIVLKDKTTIEFLVDRDELELRWIATVLRNALRL
jgi:hypothetical protein